MNMTNCVLLGTASAIVSAILTASPAIAELGAESIQCRYGIAKAYGKFLKATHKTIAKCHKARDRDVTLAGTNCNDAGTVFETDDQARARSNFIVAVSRACEGQADVLTAANFAGLREYYVSCPVESCGIVADPLDAMGEVGACLACVAEDAAAEAAAMTLGSPDPASLDSEERRCRSAIVKGYGRYLSTGIRSETACQRDQDEAGNDSLDECADTPAGDPGGKVASALAKAAAGLDRSCETSLADVDGCSAVDVDSLKTCTAAAWSAAEEELFASIYELPALGCPTAIRTTILAGCSTEGSVPGSCLSGFETATQMSLGWKGPGHAMDVTDSVTVAVDVTCAGGEIGSCGTCTTAGISQDNPQYDDFTRCLVDPWISCSNPFEMDPVCNGGTGGACKHFLGPPVADAASGTPFCTLNVLNGNIVGGAMNPDTGEVDFTLDVRAIVHFGVSQTRPCPYCRNDVTAQDSLTDGTCLDGPRDGMPCDVQGFDLTFTPVDDVAAPTSGPSLDCPPSPGANSSGSGLAITLPLTTGTSTKAAEDACEAPNAGLDCFCGVCTGAGWVTCNNDTDCSLLGFGSCGIAGAGIDRKPNNCTDGMCNLVVGQTDRGACTDMDSYCSGMLRANGTGIIACGTNADCSAYVSGSPDPDNWVCPADNCGTCTIVQARSCFLDPIEISGSPDPTSPNLAATFCMGVLSTGGKNEAKGYPGPGVIELDTAVELRY